MPQAQTGHTPGGKPALKSTPKICRINGDDNLKVIFRNLGNNHAYPFLWAETHTVASGESSVVVASGIKFHGYDLVTYGNVTATPLAMPTVSGGANSDLLGWYVEKDSVNDRVYIKTTANVCDAGLAFDVKFMLGVDPGIEDIYCRGNRGASQSRP